MHKIKEMKKNIFDKSNMILIIEEKGIMEDLFEQKKSSSIIQY